METDIVVSAKIGTWLLLLLSQNRVCEKVFESEAPSKSSLFLTRDFLALFFGDFDF